MWHPKIRPTLWRLIVDADVVHIHALFEEIQHRAAVIARDLRKPYIMRPCGALDPWVQSRGRLKKWLYMALRLRRNLNAAAAIHYVTAAEQDAAAPIGLTSPAIVEPNGVDLDEFRNLPPRGAFRARIGVDADTPLVLFLGRLDFKKGPDILIRAFARAMGTGGGQSAVSRAKLVIAGPELNEFGRTVRALAEELRVTDRTIFTGMIPGAQRIEALVDADLFVQPSHVENFGIALIEALAAGTPAILSDRVNLAGEMRANDLARVVPLDVAAIANAIGERLQEPSSRERSGRARAYVLGRFDWLGIASRWQKHYEAMVGASDGTVAAQRELA
jgi:glycosyltransferase involved in cell wall biosynthesis